MKIVRTNEASTEKCWLQNTYELLSSRRKIMNSRERVLEALDHQEPDRVPIDIGHVGPHLDAYKKIKEYFGLERTEDDVASLWGMASMDDRILKKLHADFRRVQASGPPEEKLVDGSIRDILGIVWKKSASNYSWVAAHPLGNAKEVTDIEDYNWPDIDSLDLTRGVERKARKLEDEGWAVVSDFVFNGPFNTAQWLRGEVNLARDFYMNPKIADKLITIITDIGIKIFGQFLDALANHVTIVSTSDDFGIQSGLALSPAQYRRFIKPHHKRLNDLLHQKSAARILLHSCGTTEPILRDLIEAGVDIINPVQPLAKGNEDSEELKKNFGSDVCFHGGIDTQQILPFGTVDEVKSEVRTRISAFAKNGGYILAPAQSIQPDVPIENVIATFESAYKYGRYPIQGNLRRST